jgi:hypothetical protein
MCQQKQLTMIQMPVKRQTCKCVAFAKDLPPHTRHSSYCYSGFHNLYLSFLYNRNNLKQCCETFIRCDKQCHFIVSADSVWVFTTGLASSTIFRQTKDTACAHRARKRIKQMQVWVEQGSPWNFKQKMLLMQAEEQYSNGDLQRAKELYQSAITSAKLHKFQNDLALVSSDVAVDLTTCWFLTF